MQHRRTSAAQVRECRGKQHAQKWHRMRHFKDMVPLGLVFEKVCGFYSGWTLEGLCTASCRAEKHVAQDGFLDTMNPNLEQKTCFRGHVIPKSLETYERGHTIVHREPQLGRGDNSDDVEADQTKDIPLVRRGTCQLWISKPCLLLCCVPCQTHSFEFSSFRR
jgi:hypothetical protein